MNPNNNSESIMYFRVTLLGLLIKCPFKDALQECPLTGLRSNASLTEKFSMIESLEPQHLMMIIDHHHDCYNKRQKEISYRPDSPQFILKENETNAA